MSDSPLDPTRIRRRMLELEHAGADDRSIVAAVSEILNLSEPGDPVDGQLIAAVQREAGRALTLMNDRQGPGTPRTTAAVGFLQGVTFAAAVRDILDALRNNQETP